MKNFNRNLVDSVELSTVTVAGKRHYKLPDGKLVPSVTTVLSEKLPKHGLLEWQEKQGEEKVAAILAEASRRGTVIHAIAEKYVLGDPEYLTGVNFLDKVSFRPIRRALDDNVDNIMGIEVPLYNKKLNTAGRTDLIAQYNGVNSVIDFKTSLKSKKEEWIENYFLQATVYSMMFEITYKIHIPQIVIIISADTENHAQIFIKKRSPFVKKVIEVFTS